MFRMTVADVFVIRNRGLVATGTVEEGAIRTGDAVTVNGREARVEAIEAFRKELDEASAGDTIGLLLPTLELADVDSGDVIEATGWSTGPGTPSGWEQDFPGGLPR